MFESIYASPRLFKSYSKKEQVERHNMKTLLFGTEMLSSSSFQVIVIV